MEVFWRKKFRNFFSDLIEKKTRFLGFFGCCSVLLYKHRKNTVFSGKKVIFVFFDVQDGTHSHFCGNCVILNAELKLDQGWERGF